MRISVQESAVWIFEEFREDSESKSGSKLLGLSTRQTPSRIVVQMGIRITDLTVCTMFLPARALRASELAVLKRFRQ
jgi:hypothetical protein